MSEKTKLLAQKNYHRNIRDSLRTMMSWIKTAYWGFAENLTGEREISVSTSFISNILISGGRVLPGKKPDLSANK